MSSGNFETLFFQKAIPLINDVTGYSSLTMFAVGSNGYLDGYDFYGYQSTCGYKDTSTITTELTNLFNSTIQSSVAVEQQRAVTGEQQLSTSINYIGKIFISTIPIIQWVSTIPDTYSIETYPSSIPMTYSTLFYSTIYSNNSNVIQNLLNLFTPTYITSNLNSTFTFNCIDNFNVSTTISSIVLGNYTITSNTNYFSTNTFTSSFISSFLFSTFSTNIVSSFLDIYFNSTSIVTNASRRTIYSTVTNVIQNLNNLFTPTYVTSNLNSTFTFNCIGNFNVSTTISSIVSANFTSSFISSFLFSTFSTNIVSSFVDINFISTSPIINLYTSTIYSNNSDVIRDLAILFTPTYITSNLNSTFRFNCIGNFNISTPISTIILGNYIVTSNTNYFSTNTFTSSFISSFLFSTFSTNIISSFVDIVFISTAIGSYVSTIEYTVAINNPPLLTDYPSYYFSTYTLPDDSVFTSTIETPIIPADFINVYTGGANTSPTKIVAPIIWPGSGLTDIINAGNHTVHISLQYSLYTATNINPFTWVSTLGIFNQIEDPIIYGNYANKGVAFTTRTGNYQYSHINTNLVFKPEPIGQRTQIPANTSNFHFEICLNSTPNYDIFMQGLNNITFTLFPILQ